MKKTKRTILFSLLIMPPLIALFFLKYFPGNYLVATTYKVVYLVPIFYRIFFYKTSLKKSLTEGFNFNQLKKHFPKIFIIGLVFSALYVLGYLVFNSQLDLPHITTQMNNLAGINGGNIILIGLFIILINSLFEEFFWRGFMFQETAKVAGKKLSYVLTSAAFSFHHIAFVYTWLNAFLNSIEILAIIAFAIVANSIYDQYKDLYSCWLIHIMVDIVHVALGLIILGLI